MGRRRSGGETENGTDMTCAARAINAIDSFQMRDNAEMKTCWEIRVFVCLAIAVS